jgi:hypothetical protein
VIEATRLVCIAFEGLKGTGVRLIKVEAATPGGNPQCSGTILVNATNIVIAQAPGVRGFISEYFKGTSLGVETIQSISGANPEPPAVIFRDAVHTVAA